MRKIKRILLLNIALVLNYAAFGQTKLEIIVADSILHSPAELASVTLKSIKSGLALGRITNNEGKAIFENVVSGQAIFSVSYIGFEKFTKTISLKNDTSISVFLKPTEKMLQEIKILGNEARIQNKPDRIIFNVNTMAERGKFISEVLRSVPFISIANDQMLIKGNGNFQILKDGNPSNLSLKDLEGLPSNLISSIELITIPSAKFEGTYQNVLNVIFKKDNTFTGGSFYARAGTRTSSIGSTFTNITDKTNSNGSVNLSYDYLKQGSDFHSIISKDTTFESNQSSSFTTKTPALSGNYNIEFALPKNKYISVSSKIDYQSNKLDQGFFNSIIPININSSVNNYNKTGTLNLGFTANFREKFSKSNLYISNLYTYDNEMYDLTSIGSTTNFASKNTLLTNTLTNQIDYDLTFKQGFKFEAGTKFIYRGYKSNSSYSYQPGIDILDYDQTIFGSYISFSKILKKFFFRAGNRIESTYNYLSGTSNSSVDFLPNGLISYSITESNNLSLFYRKSINRPGLTLLNTFLNRSNPLISFTGNDQLKNEAYSKIGLDESFSIKNSNVDVTLSYVTGNDLISSFRTVNSYQLNLSYYNSSKSNSLETSLSVNTPIVQKKLFFNFSGIVKPYKISASQQSNSGVIKDANAGFSYTPTSALSIEAFANCLDNAVYLQGNNGNSFFMDIMARYHLKKSTILLQFTNPLVNKINESYNGFGPNFRYSANNFYLGRSIAIGYSLRFGRTKDRDSETKEIENNDLKSNKKI